MANATARVVDGVPLTRRQIHWHEAEGETPPRPEVIRTLVIAYNLTPFEAAEALGLWPPAPGRRCSIAEFRAFTDAYQLRLTVYDRGRGIAAVQGVVDTR